MSKVPFTIDIERFACSELEDMRKMNEMRDYSGLGASIERLQRHCTAMEDALHENKYRQLYCKIKHKLDYKDDVTLEDIKEIVKDFKGED